MQTVSDYMESLFRDCKLEAISQGLKVLGPRAVENWIPLAGDIDYVCGMVKAKYGRLPTLDEWKAFDVVPGSKNIHVEE